MRSFRKICAEVLLDKYNSVSDIFKHFAYLVHFKCSLNFFYFKSDIPVVFSCKKTTDMFLEEDYSLQ